MHITTVYKVTLSCQESRPSYQSAHGTSRSILILSYHVRDKEEGTQSTTDVVGGNTYRMESIYKDNGRVKMLH